MQPQILVPLDGSEQAEAIIPPAAALARATHSVLTLLRVNVPFVLRTPMTSWAPPSEWIEEEVLDSHDYLAGIARRLLAQRLMVHLEVMSGYPATNIVAYAEESPAVVLIAMATRARGGLTRFAFGSITEQVIRTTSRPVLLLHPQEKQVTPLHSIPAMSLIAPATARTILVPLDGSACAEQALVPVQRIAAATGAIVLLVSVVHSMEGREGKREMDDLSAAIKAQAEMLRMRSVYLERKARQLRAAGVRVQTEVIIGKPSVEIQHACIHEHVGMVVMAVHDRNLFQRICASSTAGDIVRDAHLPVMLVRINEREHLAQPVSSAQEQQDERKPNTSQTA